MMVTNDVGEKQIPLNLTSTKENAIAKRRRTGHRRTERPLRDAAPHRTARATWRHGGPDLKRLE